MRLTRTGWFLLRVVVSATILAILLSHASIDALAQRLRTGAWLPLAGALSLVWLTAVLVSLRWHALAAWLGLALSRRFALRAVFLGMFGGQLLPSTVGTDAVRGWVAGRHTGSLARTATSILADRLVALFAACLLLGFAYPRLGVVAAAVLASGAVLVVFLATCGGGMRGAVSRYWPVALALAVAVAIHGAAILAAAVTAAAYGVEASPAVWLSIIPVSVIACAVPVSINGWGVREAVIAGLAAAHGIAPADALVVSMTLGALNVVASLPGGLLMLARGQG